jgi:hypothetical protein
LVALYGRLIDWPSSLLQTVTAPAGVIEGIELTITGADTLHPLSLVYVRLLVPPAIAVTWPVLFTVATLMFDDTQGFKSAAVEELLSSAIDPAQRLVDPSIAGSSFVVTNTEFEQPLLLV